MTIMGEEMTAKAKHRAALAAAALGTAALATLGASGPAQAQPHAPAAQNQKCATLWVRSDHIDVCWNWYGNSHGSYNGSYWGRFFDNHRDGRSLYLQANINNDRWVGVKAAGYDISYGVPFSGDYTDIKHLTFRACLTNGGCGHPPK
ncbi:hypothetical protein LKL35_11775 [Streptomyces sp. ET3-23]|uniref:hypothetical protein n=1 Tax=Streptomyces sp. ET3-23 TaxID=2885643 RepID=UPI001D129770|nr:hypothetical protein [Streptomyces sp. ET3-23]MCC2276088.1 hypothetical protein [Streptomyces sp. ET3-23]